MCSLVNFKSRKFAFLGTLLMAIPLLIFASEVGAGEQKLQGSNHTSSEIAAACVLAGGHYSGPTAEAPAEYGCKTSKGEVSCVGNECWGKCEKCGARLIGPNVRGVLGRPSGVALTRRTAIRQRYALNY